MSCKKYSIVKGEAVFNWDEFLNKTSYDYKDIHYAWQKAGSWVTCACGNQCDKLQREIDGSPVDYELRILGRNFFSDIGAMLSYFGNESSFESLRNRAKITLKSIEERAVYLLGEE